MKKNDIPPAVLAEPIAADGPVARAVLLGRLAAIVESSDDAIAQVSAEGRILTWNEAAARLYGYEAAEIVGAPLELLVPESLRQAESGVFRRVMEGRRVEHYRTTRRRKDGSLIELSVTVSAVRDGDGRIVGVSEIARDIGARLAHERALQESNERFELVARASNDAVWDWNLLTDELWWNSGYQALFGYRKEETRPDVRSWTDRLHPDDREPVLSSVHAAIQGGGHSWSAEYRFLRRDGSYAEVFDRGFIVRAPDGRPVRMIGAMMDITERKRAEREREKLARMYAALSALNELVARARSPQELLQGACEIAVGSGAFQFALVRWVEPGSTLAPIVAFAGGARRPWLDRPIDLREGTPDAESLVAVAWRTGRPVLAREGELTARTLFTDLYEKTGTRSAAAYPLHREGVCSGALLLRSLEPDAFDGETGELLERMARNVSYGLDGLAAAEALRRREEAFRALVQNSPDGILRFDRELRCLFVNAAVASSTGRPLQAFIGRRLDEIEMAPETLAAWDGALRRALATGEVQTVEYSHAGPRGVREYQARFAPEGKGAGEAPSVLVISRDITERKRYEAHIQHLANHDALTGLPNRTLLRDRVEQAILHAQRSARGVGLVFVDLDRFKLINDSFGHAIGDALLMEVGSRLTKAVRSGDTVARLGGDEFVILAPDLAQPGDAAVVARKVAEALGRPLEVNGRPLSVSASMGISLFPGDGDDLESLLQCADAAMYRAKDAGRNNYQFYSAEMGAQALARVETETGLRRALERDELRLFYQPQVDLKTGRIAGFEALIRWQHPERGLVSPAAFVPVAEDTGLIVPIGEWALRTACREAAAWAALGLGELKVAVNLSARQFWQGSLAETVRAALGDSGLAAERLEVEITESMVARDLQQATNALAQLRRMGVSVAIDDFGTGYSSLAYLRSLPIQKLKIDKSFVAGIPGDAEATALVGEIARLGHVLSLQVVAEGVETQPQAARLRDFGCEAVQGFLFSPPLSRDECLALLRNGRRFSFDPGASGE